MPPAARIDLHAHSTCSDGTSSVDELVAEAAAAGLDVMALTDHDTTAGWGEAAAAASRHGVAVVPGIEVSAEHGRISVHILALLPDLSPSTALARELARARDARRGRAREMVDRLSADVPIDWEQVQVQTAGESTTVGRPHIADALVAAGIVADRAEAFAGLLSSRSPYYVPHYAPSPVRAVTAIRDAGGIPVVAHPASGQRGTEVPEPLLEEMVDAGLGGIEVDHREHAPRERARLRDLARALGLWVTGGSDYHGRGKPNRLGENLTSPEVLEAMISSSADSARAEIMRP